MQNSFKLSTFIPASPDRIYNAWLSSAGHGAMTGSIARIENQVGGKFTAWDGYIMGETIELHPFERIVQRWRTTEFPDGSSDSHLEILLEPVEGGTRLTLVHTDIPEGQVEEYQKGWIDFYFTPMEEYFSKLDDES